MKQHPKTDGLLEMRKRLHIAPSLLYDYNNRKFPVALYLSMLHVIKSQSFYPAIPDVDQSS